MSVRQVLTVALLTLSMLWSIAAGSSGEWALLAIGAGWAPFVTLILVPMLTKRRGRRSRPFA
jgi:hypothetical protein